MQRRLSSTPCLPCPQGAKHLRDIFHRMGFDDKDIVALSGEQATNNSEREETECGCRVGEAHTLGSAPPFD